MIDKGQHNSSKFLILGIGIIILILGFMVVVIGVTITIPFRVKLY